MTRQCCVDIDLSALSHNYRVLKTIAQNAKVMAVVKSDAYGHGLTTVAKALAHVGADGFAVTSTQEAIVLRKAGIVLPISMLSGYFSADELPLIAHHHLWPIVHTAEQLPILIQYDGAPLTLWIKVNLGMNRLGFDVAELASVVASLSQNPKLTVKGVLGHLSHADDPKDLTTQQQVDMFTTATAEFSFEKSLAKSAGILGWADSYFDWVRPGVSLYGLSPFNNGTTGQDLGLRPVMTFRAQLMAIRQVPPNQSVGYAGLWKPTHNPSTIGLVSCGYGDGYPRLAPFGTPVFINGERAPVVGRVAMDMLSIDLTHLTARPKLYEEVILWGGKLPVEVIAKHCQTIGYELCCNAGRTRLRQQYEFLKAHQIKNPGCYV